MELTILTNILENLEGARCRKHAQYQPLIIAYGHIHAAGKCPFRYNIEMGSVGYYRLSAVQALCDACPTLTRNQVNIMALASKVWCSYHIF